VFCDVLCVFVRAIGASLPFIYSFIHTASYMHRKDRPSFNTLEQTLRYVKDNKLTIKRMSDILSVSERTIAHIMSKHGLSIRLSYIQLDDATLAADVKSKLNFFISFNLLQLCPLV